MPPQMLDMMRKGSESYFVRQNCQLIEILVGVGRKPEAESIRVQAVAVLDHPQLKSAVTDAEARIQQRSAQTGTR